MYKGLPTNDCEGLIPVSESTHQCEDVFKDEICKISSFASRDQDLQLLLMTRSIHSELRLSEMSLLPQKGTSVPLISRPLLQKNRTQLLYYEFHQYKTPWKSVLSLVI